MSPESVSSENVIDEVAFALEKRKQIIPVFYRECEIPFRLRRIQYVDFRRTENYSSELRELITGSRWAARRGYGAGRVTLFDGGRISGSTEMPEYSAELAECGTGVLAWQSKSVWLIESSGRVQVVAETDRPIRGVWGQSGGFYVLAGELSSFQVRRTEAGRGMKK